MPFDIHKTWLFFINQLGVKRGTASGNSEAGDCCFEYHIASTSGTSRRVSIKLVLLFQVLSTLLKHSIVNFDVWDGDLAGKTSFCPNVSRTSLASSQGNDEKQLTVHHCNNGDQFKLLSRSSIAGEYRGISTPAPASPAPVLYSVSETQTKMRSLTSMRAMPSLQNTARMCLCRTSTGPCRATAHVTTSITAS